METFTLAPVGGWIVRAFGRNPLVRMTESRRYSSSWR
jgi:hypothetical protein